LRPIQKLLKNRGTDCDAKDSTKLPQYLAAL